MINQVPWNLATVCLKLSIKMIWTYSFKRWWQQKQSKYHVSVIYSYSSFVYSCKFSSRKTSSLNLLLLFLWLWVSLLSPPRDLASTLAWATNVWDAPSRGKRSRSTGHDGKGARCRSNTIGGCHKQHFKKLAYKTSLCFVCMDTVSSSFGGGS